MNEVGKALVTECESIKLVAYKCPAGVWTNGRGHTKGVHEGDVLTPEQEQAQFDQDMLEWTLAVKSCLTRKPNENQLAAMTCFAFNVGLEGFKSSSVLKAFERGDDEAASRAFGLWNKITVNGQKVESRGLTIRRAKEAALYLAPVDGQIVEDMPQEVAAPKTMAASTINQASVVAGGTAAIAAATETINSINSLKTSFDGLGNWMLPCLLIVTLCAVGYIIFERFQQRKQGAS